MNGYQKAWQEYRRLRNRCFILFLGYVPVVFPTAVVFFKLFHTFVPGFLVAGGWMVWWLFECNRLTRWPCPRCGEWFAAKWWYNKGFLARRCVHCGLPKYAETDVSLPPAIKQS